MEKIIILIIVALSFVLLIRHLRKLAQGEEGCQGCPHQNHCKK